MINLLPAFVLAYSVQLAMLVGALWLALRLVATNAAGVRLRVWQAALVAAILLPASVMLPSSAARAVTEESASVLVTIFVPAAQVTAAAGQLPWQSGIVVFLLTGAVLRSLWILAGWIVLRRRFALAESPSHPQFDRLCRALDVRAQLIWRADVTQPFTFGARPALVIVPAQFVSEPDAVLSAIFTHELLHVARHDWRSVIVEEAIRALLWFHPAVWLIVSELRQAREEVIDRATVRSLGSRRTYLETLVALADRGATPRLSAALPFFGSRQLRRRIAAIASEDSMSRLRLVLTSAAVLGLAVVTLGAASQTFPMPATRGNQSSQPRADKTDGVEQSEPGPIERSALVAPADAPPPIRTRFVAPQIPDEARGMNRTDLDVRFVLDASGRVAEARLLKWSIAAPMGVSSEAFQKVLRAVLAAVRQWEFERPERAPLAITVVLTLEPVEGGGQAASIERPIAIDMKNADYPESAKTKKIQGDVEVEATIDAQGNVTETRVVHPVAPELDEAAIAAIRASTFRPGMKDGRPVPVKTRITIRFLLK